MSTTRNWRIRPTPAIEYAVEKLAREESRSLSNMLHRLLQEALAQRQSARLANAEVSRLAGLINNSAEVTA